jgi:hypothetical protein
MDRASRRTVTLRTLSGETSAKKVSQDLTIHERWGYRMGLRQNQFVNGKVGKSFVSSECLYMRSPRPIHCTVSLLRNYISFTNTLCWLFCNRSLSISSYNLSGIVHNNDFYYEVAPSFHTATIRTH